MSSAYGDRLRELFLAALELPAERRAEFLNDECAGDDELRAKVESLIVRDETAEDFMESPAVPAAVAERDVALADKRIGRYQVTRVIATGGMGIVYAAVQEKPHRTVALKVMRRGVASRSALRRFEYESQILARLRHPAPLEGRAARERELRDLGFKFVQ